MVDKPITTMTNEELVAWLTSEAGHQDLSPTTYAIERASNLRFAAERIGQLVELVEMAAIPKPRGVTISDSRAAYTIEAMFDAIHEKALEIKGK